MTSRSSLYRIAFVLSIFGPAWCCFAAEPGGAGRPIPALFDKDGVPPGADQILGALSAIERSNAWTPEANDEISRGPAAEVYPKAAPATVVVRLPDGHGTGFLISDDGWIITNHHVASHGLTTGVSDSAGKQFCLVHVGRLEDGIMTVDEKPLSALVYKLSEQMDLALLKLTTLPEGVKKLPYLKLADNPPTPGLPCVAIGHPKSGMLWTVRSGEVAGLGIWPKDMISTMMNYLSVSGQSKEGMVQSLAEAPKRKVVISSCGINPGDSGGPLLNENGELVAVTFAIPKNETVEVNLDKFSYHVHVDEVRGFIKDRPSEAPLHVPSVWPDAVGSAIVDNNGDGINETWNFFRDPQQLSGSLIDADQDSGAKFRDEINAGKRTRDTWDAELVLHTLLRRVFYDKDNDGELDEILTDTDGDDIANVALSLVNGKWTRREVENQPMIDLKLFKDAKIAESISAILQGPPRKPNQTETPPVSSAK
jgi:serine protease Do